MNIKLNLTASKLLAFLILLAGTVYGFIDLLIAKTGTGMAVITTAFASSGTVIAIKTGADAYGAGNQTSTTYTNIEST